MAQESPSPLMPTLSRLSFANSRPTIASLPSQDDGYAAKTFRVVNRTRKEVWRRSGLASLWSGEEMAGQHTEECLETSPFEVISSEEISSEEVSSDANSSRHPGLAFSSLDTSEILYPTLETHPPPLSLPLLVINLAEVASVSPSISDDVLFSTLLRRLEPWVGEEGEGGYCLIILAAERRDASKLQDRSPPGVGWWIWHWRRIPRKFRKNLKRLYIVHPSSLTRALLPVFLPLLSPKSFIKLHICPSFLHLYADHKISLKGIQLTLPTLIEEARVLRESPDVTESVMSSGSWLRPGRALAPLNWGYSTISSAIGTATGYLPLPRFIKRISPFVDPIEDDDGLERGCWKRDIDDIVAEQDGNVPHLLVDLSNVIMESCLETEGIFRRGSSSPLIMPLQAALNMPLDSQPHINWSQIAQADPLLPPVLLKRTLAELSSPLLGSKLYPIIRTCKSPETIRDKFLSELSIERATVFHYLIFLLHRLLSAEPATRMSARALAIVFAPTLISGPDPLEDAELCLEPGKTLPSALRVAVKDSSDKSGTSGGQTLTGLLEMWINEWHFVSQSSVGEKCTCPRSLEVSNDDQTVTVPRSPRRKGSVQHSLFEPGTSPTFSRSRSAQAVTAMAQLST